MAANIGSHGTAAFGASAQGPAVVVMAYTTHSDRGAHEPPTFVIVGERDNIAPASSRERRVAALRAAGTPIEFHVFPSLGHGFGLGTSIAAAGWTDEALRFWSVHQ